MDYRAVLAAVVYLDQAGCSWWKLPAALFGVSRATAHRRFTEWLPGRHLTGAEPQVDRGEPASKPHVLCGTEHPNVWADTAGSSSPGRPTTAA